MFKKFKKAFAVGALGLAAVVGLTGCGDDRTQVNLWSFNHEVPDMMEMFLEMNPHFAEQFEVEFTIINDEGGAYQIALDQALEAGGRDIPHIFTSESASVLRYTQGGMSHHAKPYVNLGIDVSRLLQEAQIAAYSVEIGMRGNDLVGLGFQATGGAMIYRASIAESVFGTSDPAEIARITGQNGWSSFLDAARQLDAAGYSAVSGAGDLWQVVRTGGQPWVVDGQLVVDPIREGFLDLHRALYQEGLMNDAGAWSPAWNADMGGTGERPVFAFFGPAWLINFVMSGHVADTYGDWRVAVPPTGFFWGGTWVMANNNIPDEMVEFVGAFIEWVTLDSSNTGLQYMWANGTFGMPEGEVGTKDVVASGTVMAMSNGQISLLGGQDMFDIFAPAGNYASGDALTEYDVFINNWFIDQSQLYADGTKTRDEALRDFKIMVRDNTAITVTGLD